MNKSATFEELRRLYAQTKYFSGYETPLPDNSLVDPEHPLPGSPELTQQSPVRSKTIHDPRNKFQEVLAATANDPQELQRSHSGRIKVERVDQLLSDRDRDERDTIDRLLSFDGSEASRRDEKGNPMRLYADSEDAVSD